MRTWCAGTSQHFLDVFLFKRYHGNRYSPEGLLSWKKKMKYYLIHGGSWSWEFCLLIQSWIQMILIQQLNVFWHKNEAQLLLVSKDGVSWLKKEVQDVGASTNMRFFWFIFCFLMHQMLGMFLFVTGKTMLCYWWHRRSNFIRHCANPSMYYWYGVLRLLFVFFFSIK